MVRHTLLALAILVPGCRAPFGGSSCRDHQNEARIDLKRLYSAEVDFKAAHSVYTTDLVSLGFSGFADARYRVGFLTASTSGAPAGLADYDPSRRVTEANAPPKITDSDFPASTASGSSFTAVAVGNLDADPVRDAWSIDDKQELRIVEDDCN